MNDLNNSLHLKFSGDPSVDDLSDVYLTQMVVAHATDEELAVYLTGNLPALPKGALSTTFTWDLAASDVVALAKKGVENPDWNPLDHPKDMLGRFIRKGSATFAYGKAKKAIYQKPGGGGTAEVELLPGEKLVKDKTGTVSKINTAKTKRTVVASASYSDSVGKDFEADPSAGTKALEEMGFEVLAEAPYTVLQGKEKADAVAALVDEIKTAPLAPIGPGESKPLLSNQKAYTSGQYTVIKTHGETTEVWDTSIGEPIAEASWSGTGALATSLVKNEKPLDVATPSKAAVHPVSGVSMTSPGDSLHQHKKSPNAFLVERENGDWTFFNSSGKELPGKGAQYVEQGHLKNYNNVKPETFSVAAAIEQQSAGTVWLHPVTGDVIAGPDDTVYRHSKSKMAYLVIPADGDAVFYNKSGKPGSAAQALAYIDNWVQISTPVDADLAANTPLVVSPGATPDTPKPAGAKPKVKTPKAPKAPKPPKQRWHFPVKSPDGEHTVQVPIGSSVYFSKDGSQIAVHSPYTGLVTVAPFDGSAEPKSYFGADAKALFAFGSDFLLQSDLTKKIPTATKDLGPAEEDYTSATVQEIWAHQSALTVDLRKDIQSLTYTDTTTERSAILGSPQAYAVLEASRNNLRPDNLPADIDSSWKSSLGKDRNRFSFLMEVSAALNKMLESPYGELSAEEEGEIASILAAFHQRTQSGSYFGSNFEISVHHLATVAQEAKQAYALRVWQAEWVKANPKYSFDVNNPAFDSTKLDYLVSKGLEGAETLSPEGLALLLKVEMGYPGLGYWEQKKGESYKSQALLLKAGAAAQVLLMKKDSKGKSKTSVSEWNKAVNALWESSQHKQNNLSERYYNANKTLAAEWDAELEMFRLPHTDLPPKTKAEMVAYLDENPGVHPAKNAKLGVAERSKAFSEKSAHLGVTKAMESVGAEHAFDMTSTEENLFIKAHYADDKLTQYAVTATVANRVGKPTSAEAKAAGDPAVSPEAKLAWQTLSDVLYSTEWGRELRKGNKPDFTDDAKNNMALLLPHVLPASLVVWYKTVAPFLPEPSLPQAPYALDNPLDTPKGINPRAWALALAVEEGHTSVVPDFPGQSHMAEYSTNLPYYLQGTQSAPFIPADVIRLYHWAANLPHDTGKDIVAAITHRANAGDYIPGDAPKWKFQNGAPLLMPPGTSVWTIPEGIEGGKAYLIVRPDQPSFFDTTSGPKRYYGSEAAEDILGHGYELLYQISAATDYSAAQAAGFTGDKGAYELVQETEKVKAVAGAADKLLAFKSLGEVDPFLKANAASLPASIVDLILSNPTPDIQYAAAFQLKQGYFGVARTQGIFDYNKPYAKHIYSGKVQAADIADWPLADQKAFAEDFDLTVGPELPDQIVSIIKSSAATPPPVLNQKVVLPSTVDLTPINKSLGGMHSKQVWVDQEGNEWMTKSFASDPNAAMRVDAEHYANVLSRLFGFNAPETRVRTEGGGYEFLQHLVPAKTTFKGKKPESLTKEQLAQAMMEHVLDWTISNHDSHSGNLLIDENDGIFGIDKGQALRFFPNDSLAVGYQPNPEPAWYDLFYNAVKSGKIDEETAHYVTRRVLRKASQMQKVSDDQVRALYNKALEKRTNFPNGMTRETFIDSLMERKNTLLSDFTELYEGLFTGSPLSMPDTTKLFDLKMGEVHLGVSAEFLEDLSEHKAFGKSLMVDSKVLRDDSIHFYTQSKPSGTTLKAEMFLTQEGGEAFEKWMNSHDFIGVDEGTTLQTSAPKHLTLPKADGSFQTLVSAAKTVNHHAGDGEYNQNTLNTLTTQIKTMEADLADFQTFIESGQIGLVPNKGMVTFEQQYAYMQMLETYIEHGQMILARKDAGEKVKPHLVEFEYSPKVKAADLETPEFTDPWPVKRLIDEDGDHSVEVWSDGRIIYFTSGLSATRLMTPEELEEFTATPVQTVLLDPPAAPEVDTESTTSVADVLETLGLTATVTKRKAKVETGKYNAETNEFVHSGDTLDKNANNGSDWEYLLEISNGMRFIYAPHDTIQTKAVKYKRGRLRVENPEWSGSEDALNDIFSVLRETGLEIEEASPESLEVTYWRQVARSFRGLNNTDKHAAAEAAITQWEIANPTASHVELLDKMREEWAKVFGFDKVQNADWTPHFHKANPVAKSGGGRPIWYRPDISLNEVMDVYNGTAIQHGLSSGSDAANIAKTGALIPSAERQRILGGTDVGGMSASSDQGHGSANEVFTRQNLGSAAIAIHPKAALRLNAYAFAGDNYGEINNKSSTDSGLQMFKYNSGTNELMIPFGISVLEDMLGMVVSYTQQQALIKYYTDLGITEINGFPLDKFFWTDSSAMWKWIKQNWDHFKDMEGPAFELS